MEIRLLNLNYARTPEYFYIIIDGVLTKVQRSRIVTRYKEKSIDINATEFYVKTPEGKELRIDLSISSDSKPFFRYYLRENSFKMGHLPEESYIETNKITSDNMLYLTDPLSKTPIHICQAFDEGKLEYISVDCTKNKFTTNLGKTSDSYKIIFKNGYSINDNGDVEKRTAWKDTIALTEEQEKAFDALTECYNKLKELGVGVVFNDRSLYALNTKNLKEKSDDSFMIRVDWLKKGFINYDFDGIPGREKWSDDGETDSFFLYR